MVSVDVKHHVYLLYLLTQRRVQFQYDWCILHGQHSPKEDRFSMTVVSYTVSAHREKRRGWSQYDRRTLPSSAFTQQKGRFQYDRC